ncbi:CHD3-type chromatin-remodeling factor PICKLE-like [Hibiscus syriacus]|uniref:CHD3-type chromatin-remodeling factor PICKLE-like n=1 Tax=Hibiscus syriacus TaxID=106335 RepID=A0A6A2YTA0_HIBSY|nr:CHD3-type chromatin-remodeling factor PICKLE-like [Hibiscus syriacus]
MTLERVIIDTMDKFPIGIRVLADDDGPTCLLVLQTRFVDIITTTSHAITALKLLRESKNEFDLVISDVHMPDMDGFKLLELVGLEMDLPVIMFSANGDTELEMNGINHGAWTANVDRTGKLNKKRKDENEDADEERDENGNDDKDTSTQKKPHLVWSPELHHKFVAAVNQLGIDSMFKTFLNFGKLTTFFRMGHLNGAENSIRWLDPISVTVKPSNLSTKWGVQKIEHCQARYWTSFSGNGSGGQCRALNWMKYKINKGANRIGQLPSVDNTTVFPVSGSLIDTMCSDNPLLGVTSNPLISQLAYLHASNLRGGVSATGFKVGSNRCHREVTLLTYWLIERSGKCNDEAGFRNKLDEPDKLGGLLSLLVQGQDKGKPADGDFGCNH